MFKTLILQLLYNFADDTIEYQIRDRLSFMRFLDLRRELSPAPSIKCFFHYIT